MRLLCLVLAIAFILGIVTPACFAQDEGSRSILKQGLLGAATGAVAASASGGKAGKGALIGAGVNVVGGALLDTVTSSPSQPAQQVQQVQTVPVQQVQTVTPYQQGYQAGYQKGFQDGYDKGYAAAMAATSQR